MRIRLVRLFCLIGLFAFEHSAHAQTAAGWDRVMQLPARQAIRLRMTGQSRECRFEAATPDSLTCAQERTFFFFVKRSSSFTVARTDILTIKLSRLGLSTWAGIGIGTAAAVGLAAGKGDASVGVAVAPLTAAGAASVAAQTDFLAHPTIYRAP